MKGWDNYGDKTEGFIIILIGIILFLMSLYCLNENIYLPKRDSIVEGRIIDREKEGYFGYDPIVIYKANDLEYIFSKGHMWHSFNIGDEHEIIYRNENPSKMIIKDDYMARFFDCITLFIAGIIFNYLGLRFFKKRE